MNSPWIAVIVLISLLFSLVFSLHKDQVEAASRTESITYQTMTPQIQAMLQLPEFTRQNLKYYQQRGGTHSLATVARIFRYYAPQMLTSSNQ